MKNCKIKIIKNLFISCALFVPYVSHAQLKVISTGYIGVMHTGTPAKPLDVAGSGGIRISQTGNGSATNELFFQDNGQIRSVDDNHRIIFDRSANILELREFGDLYFSPGATTGARTQKVTFTSAGNINLNGAANAYQINGNSMLWNNNNTNNIFVGYQAGTSSTTGSYNTLVGKGAGYATTSGTYNTASGYNALGANVGGIGNTAFGAQTLNTQSSVSYNSAFGFKALYSTTVGDNAAFGSQALYSNTTGTYNAGMGPDALYSNTQGQRNIAVGYAALVSNTLGSYNTAIGYTSGSANTTGTYNTFIGYGADATVAGAINSTAIGNGALVSASYQIRVGTTSITSIGGYQAWTNLSDGRFKFNVEENVKGLDFIKKLRPVNYQVNTDVYEAFLMQNMPDSIKTARMAGVDYATSKAVVHTGFIAQEVELAASQAGYIFDGVHPPGNDNDNYTLAYSQFVVPLVKAVQELSQKLDSVTTTSSNMDSVIRAQNEKINDLQNQITSCCAKAHSDVPPVNYNNNQNNSLNTINNDEVSSSGPAATLYQNVPNPFYQETSIQYYIPAKSQSASIMIFDLNGKLMNTLPIPSFGKGSIIINGSQLEPGMFIYSLIVDTRIIDTKRMILTK